MFQRTQGLLTDIACSFAQLPIRIGDLGFIPTVALANAAYIGSVTFALRLIQGLLSQKRYDVQEHMRGLLENMCNSY